VRSSEARALLRIACGYARKSGTSGPFVAEPNGNAAFEFRPITEQRAAMETPFGLPEREAHSARKVNPHELKVSLR